MEDERYQLSSVLFEKAIALPPADRDGFLMREAGHDPDLLARIRRMVRFAEQDGTTSPFLADVVRPVANSRQPQTGEGECDRLIGAVIGHYTIEELLGEGGFGAVYRATQDIPVRRSVAIKVLKAGVDSRQVVARFEAERQALAVMEHPHIARVIDAGQTDVSLGSRPYFVMELVTGKPITDYCDQACLPLRTRLELFIQVAAAVHHAHQRGIIHRDLKPSNILITEIDSVPAPKVIDFGIAKALHEPLTGGGSILVTNRLELLGTPQYMSPEQAEGSVASIDIRTDVYSLGVVLYELLTGGTPLDAKSLSSASYSQMLKIIAEQNLPRPSTRLAQMGEAAQDVARRRGADVRQLHRRLCGELDWITMKALDADRERRYSTAHALGEDVQRYLAHKPVEAGPPTTLYQVRKFVRRHRVGVAAIAAIVLVLLIGIVATSISMVRANRSAARAQQIAQFIQQMLSGIEPRVARGKDTTLLRTIFEQTAARINTELSDQPEAAASIQMTIGQAYWAVGEFELARQHVEAALETRRRVLGEDHPDTLTAMSHLAVAVNSLGDFATAESYCRDALERRRRVLGNDHPDTLWSLNELSTHLADQGRYPEAEQAGMEALAGRRRILGNDHTDTLVTINNLGATYLDQGLVEKAEPLYRESAEGHTRVLGEDHPNTIAVVGNLARLLRSLKKYDEAERYGLESLEGCRHVFGPTHPETLAQINSVGALYYEMGRYTQAEPYFRETLALRREAFGNDHPDTLRSINNLGAVLKGVGKLDESEGLYLEALEGSRRTLGADHPDTLRALHNFGWHFIGTGQMHEAANFLREAVEGRRRVLGRDNPSTVNSMVGLVSALVEMEYPEDALGQTALEMSLEINSISKYSVPEHLSVLAKAYSKEGHFDKAVEFQTLALEKLPVDAPTRTEWEKTLAEFLEKDRAAATHGSDAE